MDCESADPDPWLPGLCIDRYELIQPIGAGGMGVVWSARDIDLGREVAIKLIRNRRGWPLEEQRARLLREARAMARLPHPNVVTVYDVGTTDEGLFIVMERLDGGTLAEWLRSAPQSWGAVVAKFIAAGRGLAEAHRAGLVHRDFKPDNVLMGRDGVARVSDFGLAFPIGETREGPEPILAEGEHALTQEGALVGTLAYMAPEQLLGKKVTARSDQFSFCVALHEALHGVKPFAVPSGGIPTAIFLSAVEEKRFVHPPSGREVPARLRELTLRGLACKPEDRWPSMDALVAELELRSRQRQRRSWFEVTGHWTSAALASLVATLLVGRMQPAEPTAPAVKAPAVIDPHNLGFETAVPDRPGWPRGWATGADAGLGPAAGSGYEVVQDPTGAHSGSYGLRLRFRKVEMPEGFGVAAHRLPADEFRGKLVRLSGWLKTREVDGGWAGLWMRVDGADRRVLAQDDMQSRGVAGTAAWKRHSITLPVPGDAKEIYFGARLVGRGTSWVDDFHVVPAGSLPLPRRVAALPRKAGGPSLSPDGKLLAYSIGNEVQVLTLASEEVRTIALPEGTRRADVAGWYPDSASLLILRTPESETREPWQERFREIWSLSLAGGPARLLEKGVACGAVSPSGREIAFCLPGRVVVAGAEGPRRPIDASDLDLLGVAWAPDGQRLAVLAFDSRRDGWTLLLVTADGTRRAVLMHGARLRTWAGGPAGLAWISRGRVILPIAHYPTGTVLFAVPVDLRTGVPGEPAGIALVEDGQASSLSASGDGLKLMVMRTKSLNDVRLMELGPRSASELRITPADRDEWLVGWAADGKAFYFAAGDPFESKNLYRKELPDSEVSFLGSGVTGRPTLAPDRRHRLELLKAEETAGDEEDTQRLSLFSTPMAGGARKRVGSFTFLAGDHPVVQCAATCVLARTIEGGQGVFHALDLESGLGREVARVDASSWSKSEARWGRPWALSDDGRKLAIPMTSHGIRVVDLRTGKIDEIEPDRACFYVAWAPNGRTLYATCSGSPWSGQLVRIEPTGKVEVLLKDSSSWFANPMIAPDGKRIAFEARTYNSDSWMYEGL